MNFYSYSHHGGMQYHATKDQAREAAETSMKLMLHNGITGIDLEAITWGEVTERVAPVGAASHALKRQDMLSYEAAHPQIVDGRMCDAQGNLILLKNIHDADLMEHDLVLSIAAIWTNLSGKIERFKQHNFEDVTTFLELLFEKWGTKRGGVEGNLQFTTIDRAWQLRISIQKTIDFGPEIQIAQQKLVEAIREMAPEDSDIQSIVTSAFTLVDGKLNVAAILRLRKLKILNATWNEGMEIIDAAIEVISKKKQIRLYKRNAVGQYDAIPLNIAAL